MVEGHSDISKLMSKVEKHKKTKIISFDVIAHKNLAKLGIEHEIVESYIDMKDRNLIDDLTLDKTTGWYKEASISKFLQYEDINLGWLLELEIISYFIQIIKSFVGVIRIIKKENPSVVISSDFLSSMVKCIDKKIEINQSSIKNVPELYLDRIEIPLSIGKRLIKLKMSRNFAIKIKKVLESTIYSVFNLKFNFHDSNTESIILLEFNPAIYDDLLKSLSKTDKNIILLNERKPAVWNFKSLKVMKQSKAKILSLQDFLNQNLKSIIEGKKRELQQNMLQMFSLTKNFNKLFSIEGYSFWPAIKDKFSSMCIKRFNEAIEKFELSKELFTKLKINHILTLYSAGQEEKVILSVTHKLQILSINLQHGFYPQNKYFERFLPLLYSYLIPGLKIAVWGPKLKNHWLTLGVKDKDMLLVGSPRHDHYFLSRDSYKNNGTILLASNHIMQLYFAGIDTEVYLQFEQMLGEVCRISNKIPNKKLIVKLHPGQAYFDVVPIIRDIDSSIPIYQTQDIIEFIKNCDVLISVTWSTVILEAMILDKPTITFLSDPKGLEDEEAIKSGATLLVKTPDEFEKALQSVLFDNGFRNNLIEKGRKFVNEYLINQKNSSEVLVNFIK